MRDDDDDELWRQSRKATSFLGKNRARDTINFTQRVKVRRTNQKTKNATNPNIFERVLEKA
jgi:hypothetical protein